MGKEFTFTLPRFILYENRPKKEDLLESISIEENKIKNTNNKENVWQQL